ncbi:MAG: prepilin-type N-terminal cleavage/methylation domain-containing protein, partial [Gammaproteobacteria bacterium]
MKNKGFTLLEVTIVLLIVGLLLGGILGPIATRHEQKQRQDTQDKLDQIKDALFGFAITNGRLPCPDTDATPDGIENPIDGVAGCTAVFGTVPYETIGVNAIHDTWNNPFSYRVTGTWADDPVALAGTGCGVATTGVSFELCSVGDITINDANSVQIVDEIPVVVFSQGKEDLASRTSTPETDNNGNDSIYVYSDISMVTGAEYDDMMVWISPNILKYRMVQAGR